MIKNKEKLGDLLWKRKMLENSLKEVNKEIKNICKNEKDEISIIIHGWNFHGGPVVKEHIKYKNVVDEIVEEFGMNNEKVNKIISNHAGTTVYFKWQSKPDNKARIVNPLRVLK